MALLEGIVGGATAVHQFGQQQFENKRRVKEFDESVRQYDQNYSLAQDNYNLSKRQTVVNEAGNTRSQDLHLGTLTRQGLQNNELSLKNKETEKGVLYDENDVTIGELTETGYINKKLGPMRLDREQSLKNVISGGAVNDQAILKMANRDVDIPENFSLDQVTRLPNGLIVVSGKYKDGKRGVLTVDGKISDDAKVAALPPETLVGLMDDEYRTNIRGNSRLGASSATADYLVSMGMAEADAGEIVNRETAVSTVQTQVVGELERAAEDPATGEGKNVEMVRSFKAVLANAETEDEKVQILTEQAVAMGIEVPSILTKPAPAIDENSIKARLAEAEITPEKWSAYSDAEKQEAIDVLNIRDTVETVGKWIMSPLAPAADALMLGPRAVSDVGKMIGNSKLGRAAGLSEVGDKPQYSNPTRYIDEQNIAMQGTPDITLDQANANFTAIANQPAEIQQAAQDLETGLFAKINTMTPEEVVEYVDAGGFEPTAEDEKKLAVVLQNAGVKTAADIKKLPTGAQLSTRAWLRSMALKTGDKVAAENIRKEMVNLGTGGTTDMTAGEAQDLAIKQQNADSATLKARTGVFTANTGRINSNRQRDEYYMKLEEQDYTQGKETGLKIVESMKQIDKALYELDDDGEPTFELAYNEQRLRKALVGADGALTKLQRQLKNASAQNRPQIRSAVNSTYSIAIQAMAESEEYGTFGEILPDGAIDFIDGNDKFLSRVFIAEKDTKGNPMRFGIRSLSSATQIEETISASVIKNTFGNQGYADFREELAKRRKARAQDDKIKQTGIGK